MKSKKFLIVGLPGSGKGTQGARLAAYFKIPEISSGDLIRDHIERGTEFGRKVASATAAGNFVPDADMNYWIGQRLLQPDATGGFILDGYPRSLEQAINFDERHGKNAAELQVIELRLPESAVVARLSGREVCPQCGRIYNQTSHQPRIAGHCDADGCALTRRPDDTVDAIKHRIEVYENRTAPLVNYYCRGGRMTSVDADGDEDVVFERILKAVGKTPVAV